jgi:hypothetical protein
MGPGAALNKNKRHNERWMHWEIWMGCKLMRAATLALANHKDEYEVER